MKNALRDSRRWLGLPINQNAPFNANPVLGPRLVLPHALRAQQALPIQTRAPPASLSAYRALLVIIRQTKDKVHALLVRLELGVHLVLKVATSALLATNALHGLLLLLAEVVSILPRDKGKSLRFFNFYRTCSLCPVGFYCPQAKTHPIPCPIG